ncbi:MAG: DNA polymerase III subunit alpha [Flavobacteriales bacterium CG_4_9_14_3_um_filter_40_17]|nr:MAG: DNA polymerase III subunit alpha [Flavobacteriales bacterium CG_4_9_14_3_um_filter_40_17]
MYLIFDTETTGLPKRYDVPVSETDNWPRCVQLAWQLHENDGQLVEHKEYLIKPDGFIIPFDAETVHGISTELAESEGVPIAMVLKEFQTALIKSDFLVGQNLMFDVNILGAEFYRLGIENTLDKKQILDTCTEVTAELLKLSGGRGGKFKLPTLSELHQFLFDEKIEDAHNASADVEATARCFFELKKRKTFSLAELKMDESQFEDYLLKNPNRIESYSIPHRNLKKLSDKLRVSQQQESGAQKADEDLSKEVKNIRFSHLHTHSRFSVLQATSTFAELVQAAHADQMPALALTDVANLMGAFLFVKAVNDFNKKKTEQSKNGENEPDFKPIKPIIGCELFVCDNHLDKSRKDNGYQMVFLAKNKNGYRNLCKLSSLAYVEGFYYVPRIDKELVKKYAGDLIVLSGNTYGEIYSKILTLGAHQAEEALLWWKEVFGNDFYLEIMRHKQEDEDRANEFIIAFSKNHKVKLVATNNTYYTKMEDAESHDILMCVKDGEKQSTPIGRGRGYRYGMPNQEYCFKSTDEMKQLFSNLPEAIINVQEVVDKIEPFSLNREILLPKFDIPKSFLNSPSETLNGQEGENNYLRHLTYEGAKKRYPELTTEIRERLDFELETVAKTGYPGYFLIVQDLIAEARRMDVTVGPGRGSAAGSVVAYCLGITNIDPLKYNLLFERFLNPERVSLPDIDIDFDDEGRSKVMDYVIQKYGANQVAQIITYGTMGAKSAIRDTARVLDLPLSDADRLAKLIPDLSKFRLSQFIGLPLDELKEKLRSEEFALIEELRNMANGNDLTAQTIRQASVLEGSLRNTGIHACGVIITPEDLTNLVPIATAKDSDLYATQFDNSVVESAGLLKMDFLGLKTLTLIKDTVKLVKYRRKITLNPDEFPIDDAKTYELFQRGETVGIFQYESPGMQKYLRELKPTVFEDLIAMNALYRPGPIEYIPSFIRRKNGEETISYDLPEMQEFLEETYGITVYQEQVMLLSQKLANFTKGEADQLRKAMGKKLIYIINQIKPKFIENGKGNGHPEEVLEKIWKDWEAFASYAFNKSHSTCYAWIAYQTAYLKANYPAEYMAAVLSNNMSDIKKVSFFMEECKRMGLQVLSPDVNESYFKFTVNENNAIRFGMGAVKGVGAGAVDTIVENRKNSKYKSVFDLAKRIDLRAANKKAFENLALAGALDSFEDTHRAQYFHDEGDGVVFLEKALRYGAKFQENENASQISLFGESSDVVLPEPQVPPCEAWSTMEKLKREKEVVGIYISGHPLDDYSFEIKYFTNADLSILKELDKLINKELSFAGIVSNVQHRVNKMGKGWATFTVDDYSESHEFRIFGDEYLKFRHFLVNNYFLFIKLSVREGWVNKETGKLGDPKIQFNNVLMLHDVMEQFSKKISIQLDIEDVTEPLIDKLQNVLKRFKGNHPLQIVINEREERWRIPMVSRVIKVNINHELLNTLQEGQFEFWLN